MCIASQLRPERTLIESAFAAVRAACLAAEENNRQGARRARLSLDRCCMWRQHTRARSGLTIVMGVPLCY